MLTMFARSQRPVRMFRAIVLLTVALGLAAQSLVAVVGELHDLTAHAASAHGHADHHVAHDQEAPDTSDRHAREEGSLHGLLHHTHSCSHCAWMTAGFAPVIMLFHPATRLPPEATGPAASTRLTTPFRPPILA
jgi:hypothetical protein